MVAVLHKWGHANQGALNGILLLQDTYDFDVQSAVAKGQIISEAICSGFKYLKKPVKIF